MRVYRGGHLNERDTRLWASADFDYAAAFAQLYDSPVWILTLDVTVDQVLDLTDCGLDVSAVATDLLFAGIAASVQPGDERHPQKVLRRVSSDAIRAAGYRVVRFREWIDWGAGERHAESLCIVDMTAVVDREALPLPDRNFQFADASASDSQGELGCPLCQDSRAGIVAVNETKITFQCDACGHRWSEG